MHKTFYNTVKTKKVKDKVQSKYSAIRNGLEALVQVSPARE